MRFFGSAFMALVALAAFIAIAGGGATAEAAKFNIRGVATGAEENPPVVNGGSVYVTFSFDDVTSELTYAATVSGLSADLVTASHIHRGAKGQNGPVIIPLTKSGDTYSVPSGAKLNAAQMSASLIVPSALAAVPDLPIGPARIAARSTAARSLSAGGRFLPASSSAVRAGFPAGSCVLGLRRWTRR